MAANVIGPIFRPGPIGMLVGRVITTLVAKPARFTGAYAHSLPRSQFLAPECVVNAVDLNDLSSKVERNYLEIAGQVPPHINGDKEIAVPINRDRKRGGLTDQGVKESGVVFFSESRLVREFHPHAGVGILEE